MRAGTTFTPICFICGVGRRALGFVIAADNGGRFVPVAITTGSGAAVTAGGAGLEPAIEVVLRNGRVLRLPAGVSPARAGALADLLERS